LTFSHSFTNVIRWPFVAQQCEPMAPIVEQEWDLNAQRGHSEHIVAQELRRMTVQEGPEMRQ